MRIHDDVPNGFGLTGNDLPLPQPWEEDISVLAEKAILEARARETYKHLVRTRADPLDGLADIIEESVARVHTHVLAYVKEYGGFPDLSTTTTQRVPSDSTQHPFLFRVRYIFRQNRFSPNAPVDEGTLQVVIEHYLESMDIGLNEHRLRARLKYIAPEKTRNPLKLLRRAFLPQENVYRMQTTAEHCLTDVTVHTYLDALEEQREGRVRKLVSGTDSDGARSSRNRALRDAQEITAAVLVMTRLPEILCTAYEERADGYARMYENLRELPPTAI